MLSIAPIAGGGAGYYAAQDNYYFLGNLQSRWLGEGAQALGLEGVVDAHQLDELIAGRLPNGESLEHMSGGKNVHRSGYDLTFSAPKSVSVLIALYGESRLLEAHNLAVETVSKEIEAMVGTRVMTDGKSQHVLTEKMVAATFNHDTSRNLDPQIHTHLLLLNMTKKDGRWSTLSSDRQGRTGTIDVLYDNKIALGQIYRHELRRQVEAMGYETVNVGRRGLWEIKGVPVDIFSTRSREIREAAGEGASAKSLDVAALDTRQVKQKEPDRDELLTEWHERIERTGFSYSAFREKAQAREAQLRTEQVSSGVGEKNSVLPGQAPSVSAPLQRAVSGAISLLSDRKTQFTYSEVLSRTLAQVEAEPGSIALARAGIEQAIRSGELVPLDKERGLFTSSIHLLDELSVQQLAQQVMRENRVMVTARPGEPLQGAIAVLADTLPAVAIISTGRGAGVQREQVQAVVALAESQGRQVQVFAPDKKGVVFLAEQPGLAGRVRGKELLSGDELAADSTLVVAGAEKLSVKETVTLLDQALRNNVQVLLMDGGGRKGTGNALATLEDAGVVRLQGGTDRGVRVSVISQGDRRQRYEQLAQDYAVLHAQGESVVAQVAAREQGTIAQAIRQELRRSGALGDRETMIQTLTPVFLDSKTRRLTDSYREGQILERYEAERRQTARYTIGRVTALTRTLTLTGADGQSQLIKIRDLDSSWRLYQPGTLAVAEGEKLTLTGKHGKLRAGDSVTVESVAERTLTVRLGGRLHRLPVADGLKISHGYVTTPGKTVSEQGVVLAAVSARDTQAQTLNTLATSGDRIQIYTSLSEAEAQARLERSPLYRQAREQVSPDGRPLDVAMREAKSGLMPVAEKAVRQAIAVVQGSNVVFSRPDVAQEALKAHPDMTFSKAGATFRTLVQRGEVLAVPGDGSETRYVPAETWLQEKAIIRTLAEGKGTQAPLMQEVSDSHLHGLTAGQQAASRLILESTDRFVAIQGYAGVGKTTQFRSVLAALNTLPEGQRPEVVGLAPTHRAVSEMQSVGVEAQTIASFLMDTERRQQTGEKLDFSGTLFLIDESSMVGNKDMADTLTRIAGAGGRGVLSGDSLQLQPVASGAPFTLMQQRSAIDVAVMKDIVRQTPELRPAVYALLEGRAPQALDTIRRVSPEQVPRDNGAYVPVSSVTEIRQTAEQKEQAGDRVISAIVDDYTGRTSEARRQTLIVTQMNADALAINTGIHDRLHAAGKTGEREVTVPVLVREKTLTESLKSVAGLAQHSGDIALINQQYYTIHSPDRAAGVVMLRDTEGRDHLLSAFESSLRDIAVFSRREIWLSEGDLVRFTRQDREQGRDTQTLWEVSRIADNGDITLKNGDGTRLIQPGREMSDMHLDYGYAGTAHRAQGASEAFVIALAGATGARQRFASLSDAYVALSRMKQHVQVYTDDIGKWQASVAASESRKTAHDVLEAEQDIRAVTGQTLWEQARTLNDSALGRALLRETGLSPDGEARFISGSRKYPQPHIAWPAYDTNGRQQGVWLTEIRMDDDGRLQGIGEQGRLLGHEQADLIVLQRGRSGVTLTASGYQDALEMARQHPEHGVILKQQEAGALPSWLTEKLTQGRERIPDADLMTTQNAHKTDSELLSLTSPDEKARQEAERAIINALKNEERRHILPEEAPENAAQKAAEQALAEREAKYAERDAIREEKVLARLAQQELNDIRRQRAQDVLRETEKELVINREKTL
ncbi:conjugative transfer relaxase/helicase TraI [Escherichia coli]|uniref:Conjugative transfer relaxase protein TraI n=1 Tax=Escherichia coli TA447 TaxID=656447 RepID=A0A1X3ITL6_ECOLX|nr:conjugative transfer relaxase/helicase TraI [Escherichia coli]OSK88056.1 conjugative transfer relaxase protein TraI [Escherichia coli TA447]